MRRFWKIVIDRRIALNALRIALMVGTVLNFINQGNQLWTGLGIAWEQIMLNYLVPYCVATYSAAKNEMDRS